MKKLVILLFLGFTVAMFANENKIDLQDVKMGDVFVISKASAQKYRFLDFPAKNFILKKGGMPDYKSVEGNKVKVVEIDTNTAGETVVTLERVDGTRFYNRYKTVKANLNKAIDHGELVE